MSSEQTWRIAQLEKEVKELREFKSQVEGMGMALKWAIRISFALLGSGGILAVIKFVQWMSTPFPKGH